MNRLSTLQRRNIYYPCLNLTSSDAVFDPSRVNTQCLEIGILALVGRTRSKDLRCVRRLGRPRSATISSFLSCTVNGIFSCSSICNCVTGGLSDQFRYSANCRPAPGQVLFDVETGRDSKRTLPASPINTLSGKHPDR